MKQPTTRKKRLSLLDKLYFIQELIRDLEDQIEDHDTGHIHTAITVLHTEEYKIADSISFALKNQKTINDDDYVDDLKDILGDNLSYGGTA